MPLSPDPSSFFRLKPIRVARVSEISETTAAVSVPTEMRVNFHIGNPLQDRRLSSAFLRIALGIDVAQEELNDGDPQAILEYLGWDPSDRPKLDFLVRTIQKSSPYMARGGYSRRDPHDLVKKFCVWLERQQEPLHYDAGEQSGRREIILASGGIHEALRILLFTISSYLERFPARVLCYRCDLSPVLKRIPNLVFEDLAAEELAACENIQQILAGQPETPTFLLIGDQLGEITRRKLRLLSIEHPLFNIEVNDAPNHQSLAREARLVQRVIRLLSPAIFAPRLHDLSTVFVAGNAEFLSVMENVQFNLKGTPSASEVELLDFLLEQNLADLSPGNPPAIPEAKPCFEGLAFGGVTDTTLSLLAERVEHRVEGMMEDHVQILDRSLGTLKNKSAWFTRQVQRARKDPIFDEFAAVEAGELLDLLFQDIHRQETLQALKRSFISAFVKHHPQYRSESCLVVSGSSRTALGILGSHCGVTEVVIPDLSWSYEQCFPTIHAVPLTASLELDVDAFIEKVNQLCRRDPSWPKRGAVVINNPHNATGRIFAGENIRKLVTFCLEHGILLIDDLAYQNVAPVDELPEIKTLLQTALELVHQGVIDAQAASRVITVHSMSKIDCLAGARIAVVEIRDQLLRRRFEEIDAHIQPNIAAILICYLFYRGSEQATRTYWRLRNAIFGERTRALLAAVEHLPPDRNPFHLDIVPPTGSMYPLLRIGTLPPGLSLDWLASSLARRGIGLLPLATFARTEKGYETGRSAFRLTLGGVDDAEILSAKTRRLLIHLNRVISEEDARNNRKQLSFRTLESSAGRSKALSQSWDAVAKQILSRRFDDRSCRRLMSMPQWDSGRVRNDFFHSYAPERLEVFRTRLIDRATISAELVQQALGDGGKQLAERLDREFMKDSIQRRQELFRSRPYDRTVHPTQMFSLRTELAFDDVLAAMIAGKRITPTLVERAARSLLNEYLGLNVAISSRQEADEVLLDLAALTAGEQYSELFTGVSQVSFLSFWSDWDGSNRPSGQGHQLVAALVMENVRRMASILHLLWEADSSLPVDPELLSEIDRLAQRKQKFAQLLNAITLLTHNLEQRYRGILAFSLEATPLQRLATKWRLRRDPVKVMWQHNDRYEQKMLELRGQRRSMLEYYFSLNKRLRKQLHALIPAILDNRASIDVLREAVAYRDILQRAAITPRIQQGLITARDPFAIDTTVYNMYEINTIAGQYGNPGITMALQVSMSSRPEALISLDRKMRTQCEQTWREYPSAGLPSIWLIPLFEDVRSIENVRSYLDQVWDYATQSRQAAQSPQSRFTEIITEIFIAGSDLSQQVSQAAGAFTYQKAKLEVQTWLAEHGATETVRIKIGSGEPMQRQGAYYSPVSGVHAFLDSESNNQRFLKNLPAAARKSTSYAVTPLQGVFLGGDLRTFQSNLSEQLRFLPVRDFVSLQYHVRESHREHCKDLIRAAETITESRLGMQSQSLQELERLTIGTYEALYEQFLEELTANFRQILYGKEEDVVGIHIISYFIGRTIPQLRDRPTSRRSADAAIERGQRTPDDIAEIIPLAKRGSLLRAISHNQAQTTVLGVNQLTTGLFRVLERFAQKTFAQAEQEQMIAERLLPYLPIYEILRTLRIYHDPEGEIIKRIETAFPAGNSAFLAIREDNDAMQYYLPLFQQELLRRHGVNVNDFFTNGVFIPDLLPTLRPDLAVLLQENLFNTEIDALLQHVAGSIANDWRAEVARLLQLPQQIRRWRSIIWDVIGESIYQRVQSFTELATALYSFSSSRSFSASPPAIHESRLSPSVAGFFRVARADDEMRNFLIGAIEYLGSFTEGNLEMPVSVIRVMNDVERLAHVEESVLSPEKQNLIRCCVLQIARLAGENG